jgi:hypothetical protein
MPNSRKNLISPLVTFLPPTHDIHWLGGSLPGISKRKTLLDPFGRDGSVEHLLETAAGRKR